MTRRAAIRSIALLLATAAGAARPAAAIRRMHRDDPAALETWLTERLGHLDWSEIGAAAAAFRDGASRETIAVSVLASRKGDEPLDRLVARSVAEDFSSGAVIDLAGWRLARTEARLLALLPGR